MKRTLPALLLTALAGCRSAPPPRVRAVPVAQAGTPIKVADAEALLARVRQVNDGYRTLETVHQVTLEITLADGRSEKRSFRAMLAVKRPAQFRMQMLGPAGIKMIDLGYEGGRARLLQVAPELARSSRLPAIMDSVAGDIATIFRLDPQPAATTRRMEESISLASGRAPLYELKEYRDDERVRQLTVFAATLAISRSETSDGHGGSRTLTFGDYERLGSLLIPRNILLAREGAEHYWLAIYVESVIVDPPLDPRLFETRGAR